MRLTSKYITKKIEDCGERLSHDLDALKHACRKTGRKYKIKPIDIFNLLCFNEPIEDVWTHSYGFQTGTGRAIIEETKKEYYRYDEEIK
jgi:hypothetical protein